MGEALSEVLKRLAALEATLGKTQKRLERLDGRLKTQGTKLRSLDRKLGTRIRREEVVMSALGMTRQSKPGDQGFLEDLNDSILRLEEYLLRTTERIDNILRALKNHREFLVRMNKRMDKVGARERLEMGLGIMKNTLSILALNGVRLDTSIVQDIDALVEELGKEGSALAELEKRKEALDEKFDGELRKFDLESIYEGKTVLPGYQ